ncbi:MAG: signal peptide peptidase SppA [Candidatus Eisenbacteria bacterium]|nr:signal peptide peptidase SppA [Candidatus Eisenbacteria bacterium]
MRGIMVAAAVLLAVAPGHAQFVDDVWVHEGASVAYSDNASAVFVNPAGLGMYNESNAWSTVSMVGDDVARFGGAMKLGGLGIGYRRDLMWEEADGGLRPGDDAVDTAVIGVGFGESRVWSVGLDYRWIRPNYGDEERVGTWDAGVMVRPTRWLSVGAAAHNISEPDFAVPGGTSRGGASSRMTYTAGVALRPAGDRLTFMVDGSLPREEDLDRTVLSAGLEAVILDGVTLRGAMTVYPDDMNRDNEESFGLWFDMTSFGTGASYRSYEPAAEDIYTLHLTTSVERQRTIFSSGGSIAEIKVAGPLSDGPAGWSLFGTPRRSAQSIIREIRKASESGEVDVLLLRIRPVGGGFLGGPSALLQEIRQEVVAAREEHGLKVVAFLEYGGGTPEYYLASAADEIVLDPSAFLDGIGSYVTVTKFTGSAGKLGIEFDYFTAGGFKSTFHQLGPDSLTADQAEEVQELVDATFDVTVDAILDGRRMSASEFAAVADGRPLIPEEALELGLVDTLGGIRAAKATAAKLRDGKVPEDPSSVGTVNVAGWRDRTYAWNRGPTVAVIGAYGGIHVGEGGNDPVMGGSSIGSETLSRLIEHVRQDDSIEAVVLRVDSGGGSGLATDIIMRELILLADKKPLIVSMGNFAASGGYGISVPAHHIVADPLTLTGSIGVVGMKPVLAELYEKIDARHETFKSGRHADIWTDKRHMTDEELRMADDFMNWFYEDFVASVAQGRDMTPEEVKKLAGGRVYTGRQALDIGLVDELGGLSDAVDRACEEIGVSRDDATVVTVRERESFFDVFLSRTVSNLGLHRFFGRGGMQANDLARLEAVRGLLDR